MTTTDLAGLCERLRAPSNWLMQPRGKDWKSVVNQYDRAPFEAAAAIESLVAENERLLRASSIEQSITVADVAALCEAVERFDEYGHLYFEVGRDDVGRPIHPPSGEFPANTYVVRPHPRTREHGITYGELRRLVNSLKSRTVLEGASDDR